MRTFDANYFEDYPVYTAKKRQERVRRENKIKKKKERKKLLQDYNSCARGIAKHYAEEMKTEPSELEKKMQKFLDDQNIQYNFQRVFYIKDKEGKIIKFYIADFYIPSKNLIIETDGAFHDRQIKEDMYRTKNIQKHYTNVRVIRWRWHDFDSKEKTAKLSSMLKIK